MDYVWQFLRLSLGKVGEDRLIIIWSQVRADRDRRTREDILEKIAKKLKNPKVDGKTFVSNTNYRKYVTGLNKGAPQLNEGAISRESLRKEMLPKSSERLVLLSPQNF